MLAKWALFLSVCILPIALLACSETPPAPGGSGDGLSDFEGQIDPSSNTFVLKSIDIPDPSGVPIRIELIGRFPMFRIPEQPGQVLLLVSVRNADFRTLFAPGEIVLSRFVPTTVAPWAGNPDWTTCPEDSSGVTIMNLDDDCKYGYDYSELLGDDGKLDPGETSGEKLWIFYDPEEVSFSFRAQARFALEPDRPRIAGLFYSDENRNGQFDPDELPFGGGWVRITGPDISRTVQVGGNGRYSIAVREPGLYSLWATPPPTFAPVEPTTSNPQVVVLVRGADGEVQSFLHADFGWANAFFPGFPPIRFVDNEEQLQLDPYTMVEAWLEGQVLFIKAGFSGCSPDHPFQLAMVGGLMESEPPQARLLLAHDDRDEPCDAAFMRELGFDVGPILRENGNPTTVILRFEDWHGTVHSFTLHSAPTPN